MRDALINDEIKQAGAICEVSEEEAQMLCAPKKGVYTHSGYRPDDQASRANLAKAVRL
jgi:hypothetical protein